MIFSNIITSFNHYHLYSLSLRQFKKNEKKMLHFHKRYTLKANIKKKVYSKIKENHIDIRTYAQWRIVNNTYICVTLYSVAKLSAPVFLQKTRKSMKRLCDRSIVSYQPKTRSYQKLPEEKDMLQAFLITVTCNT